MLQADSLLSEPPGEPNVKLYKLLENILSFQQMVLEMLDIHLQKKERPERKREREGGMKKRRKEKNFDP